MKNEIFAEYGSDPVGDVVSEAIVGAAPVAQAKGVRIDRPRLKVLPRLR